MHQDAQNQINLLGQALINRQTCPPLTTEGTGKKYGRVYYAVLKTNESFKEVMEAYHQPFLTGSFVGVGFGASFLNLKFFFRNTEKVIFVDREPYVYLMGKIILRLLNQCPDFNQFIWHLINPLLFSVAFQEVVMHEPEQSPVFIREPREKMLQRIPDELINLRGRIFEQRDKEYFFDAMLRTPQMDTPLKALVEHFITDYLNREAFYNLRVFREDYAFFQAVALKAQAYCADIFHPDFWSFLSRHSEWFARTSLIYLSNAAVYSTGSGQRRDEIATSTPYQPEVVRRFLTAVGGEHYFAYTTQKDFYRVRISRQPPPTTMFAPRPVLHKTHSSSGRRFKYWRKKINS